MNCKQGDIARIIGPAESPNRDRLVRCIRRLAKGEEMIFEGIIFVRTGHAEFWAVEGRLEGEDQQGRIVEINGGPIGDRWLRPIRDPGDDAISEDVRPLPAVVAL